MSLLQANYKQIKSAPANPETFGAVGDGVTDDTAAINAALVASTIVEGSGDYYCATSIIVANANTTLKLHTLKINAPVKYTSAANCVFEVDYFSVADTFISDNNMLEIGTLGDDGRVYNFNARINYVTGASSTGTILANVVRNYNATFSTFNIERSLNTKNVYTCDQPAVALGDNKICGNIIENADFGVYLYGTDANHVEHHILDYNFVAGARYGAYCALGRAHYQVMTGAYDFNGQSVVQLDCATVPAVGIGSAITGSSSGATGVVIAVVDSSIVAKKGTGTFTTSDTVGGATVSTVTSYAAGGPFLDFISATTAGFARHTINAAFLTNVFGNNQEDWVVIKAFSGSNARASIAGHTFVASSGEQYISCAKGIWSLRNPTNEKILDWSDAGGLVLGAWSTSPIITAERNLRFNGGGFATPHIILGEYHLWVDSTGDLRIKQFQPTSDTDGTVVGTQT
jgi:hypothetical protein